MKKTMPMVSVIIPVYNTAAYLAECLDSVINQEIPEMEIIVVNDGSIDGSLEIIRRYSEQDDRIIILDKANQGASAARNDAMRMAKADHIMFLDSDDVFTADVVKTAYNRICRNAGDIIIFNGRSFEDDGKIRRWYDKFYFNLDEKDENHIAPGLYWIGRTGGRIQQPGMKIYRREFIVENDLKFGDSLTGEDYFFFYMCMIRAQRVGYMHFEGYCRRYRHASLETDKSIHGTQERIRSFGQILSTLNFVKDEKYRRIIGGQHAYYASVLWVRCMIRQDTSERNVLLKEFCSARLKEFIRKNRNDWKLRVLSFFISLPESLLWLQIIFARAVRLSFKSKIRLLY
ncbi:MAG: glycosyltransferase family 2 protein [Smithella sp.]|jgi:glycosyltransferase involved in cell wall biosynthesis